MSLIGPTTPTLEDVGLCENRISPIAKKKKKKNKKKCLSHVLEQKIWTLAAHIDLESFSKRSNTEVAIVFRGQFQEATLDCQ